MRGEIHKATVWRVLSIDRNNVPEFSEPEVIDVRWVRESKVYTDSDGTYKKGMSVVYTRTDKGIKEGDRMMFGVSEEISPSVESFDVKQVRIMSNLSGSRTECRYIL